MDDEVKQLLREIRELQKEQLELLKANMLPPWLRFRFSLRALLIALTLVALVLGITTALNSLRGNTGRAPTKTTTVAPPSSGVK